MLVEEEEEEKEEEEEEELRSVVCFVSVREEEVEREGRLEGR
jgi:hypothetical protein